MSDGDQKNGNSGDGERLLPADRPDSHVADIDDTIEMDELAAPIGKSNADTEEVVWEDLTEVEPGEPETAEIPETQAPIETVGSLIPGDSDTPHEEPEPVAAQPSLSLVDPIEDIVDPVESIPDPTEPPADDGTSGDYVAATTMEYQGLAEAVLRSETETHELHAVAATMPGMDSGVVGFEDVTGEAAPEPVPTGPGDLPARVITAVILGGLFIGSLLAGGVWLMILVGAVAVLSIGEFYAAARRIGYVPVAAFGLVGTIGAMVGGWFGGPGGVAGAIALFTMLVLLWYSVMVRRDPLENAAVTVFGLVWVGGLLAFAAPIARHPDYRQLLVTLVLTAAFMDIGAYFIGRSVGRRKLAPVLSPKKTVEGLIGGVAVAFGVAVLSSLVFEAVTFSGALWLALGVSVMAPLGDIAESMVKRSFGIKDMGSLLPGHGGFLDRIDALLFVVPVAYYIYLALGYLD